MKVDIAEGSGWAMNELTDAVSREVPTSRQISDLDWEEKSLTTKTATIDVRDGQVDIVDDAPYNGVPQQANLEDADSVAISVPSHPFESVVMPEEVSARRAFGTEGDLETVEGRRQEHVQLHAKAHSLTHEVDRIGAIQGLILRRDGSVKRNVGQMLGKTPLELDAFPFDDADADIVEYFLEAKAMLDESAGDLAVESYKVFATHTLFSKARKNKKLVDRYMALQSALGLFGAQQDGLQICEGVTLIEYRPNFLIPRSAGRRAFPTDKMLMLPVAQGQYQTRFAPAQTDEYVNTAGLPIYMWANRRKNGRGIELQSESNHVHYVRRPEAIGIVTEDA